jgi:sialate O-acetylesterase
VAYSFAQDLRKELNVPVGIISTNYGGTPAESWTSRGKLESNEELKPLLEITGKGVHTPTVLYNAMIAPLVPYAIRGAIWYQGESNAGNPKLYQTLFPAMIADWRSAFGQGDFPFLFVQLAPFMAKTEEPVQSGWAELREAQLLTLSAEPNTGMAVITDLGDEKDIHPKQKQLVGARLALAARKLAYGQDITHSGPLFKEMKVEGDRAILSFEHVGGGLVAKDGPLTGFAIAGSDGTFHKAQAEIQGDTVVVSSPEVKEPKAVRYGWANFPVVNLTNTEGLPASPFRTDR